MDPDGSPVTVLTGPLRDQAALRGVLVRLWDLALEVDLAYPETVETASRTITALFVDAPIPAEVAGAIAQAYAAHPGLSPAVAVRSSATAEDLPTASFWSHSARRPPGRDWISLLPPLPQPNSRSTLSLGSDSVGDSR